jgi:hypothetical protein
METWCILQVKHDKSLVKIAPTYANKQIDYSDSKLMLKTAGPIEQNQIYNSHF